MRIQTLLTLITLCVLPQWAYAHLVSTRFGEFYSGLLHPVLTLTHLVPWIAVGLFAGIQKHTTGNKVLILFPLTVLAGTFLGGIFSPAPFVETFNLISFPILGILIISGLAMNRLAFIATVAITGISHGFGNGLPELTGTDQLLYLMGVTCSAYVVVTLMSGLSRWLVQSQNWGLIAVRAAGSWITAIGIIYLSFTFLAPVANH